jgi:hypothetical protein
MRKQLLLVFTLSFWMVNSVFASMVSDAPAPYGKAWHETAEWQKLGSDHMTDDGVWWSIDNGATWGHDELTVGDAVVFRFDLWTSGTGVHDYNQVKAWVDWDQDYAWANDNSEVVLEQRVFQMPSNPNPVASTSVLTSAAYFVTEDMIGDLWLRARAQCNHVPFGSMTPYGGLWQGEVEDWRLIVHAADVPEPESILLMGLGLLGLIGVRIRHT